MNQDNTPEVETALNGGNSIDIEESTVTTRSEFNNAEIPTIKTSDQSGGETANIGPKNGSGNLEGSDEHKNVHSEKSSRKFSCKPKRLVNDIRAYVFLLCLFYFVVAMSWGTFTSSISTLEKRFNLRSSQSGMILGAYEIGHLGFALLISHFGNRWNIPKIFSLSITGMAVAHILIVLPKFVVPSTIQQSPLNSLEINITENLLHVCPDINSFRSKQTNSTCVDMDVEAAAASSDLAFAVFVVAFVCLGIFGTPGTSLAISYLDNNTESPSQSAFYLGLSSALLCVGPMVGGFLNAHMLALPEDLGETNLTPEHPSWVGAWWIQKLLEGGFFLTLAIPLFFFPRRMKRDDHDILKDKEGNKLEQVDNTKAERADKNIVQDEEHNTMSKAKNKYMGQAENKRMEQADDKKLEQADDKKSDNKKPMAKNKQNHEKNGNETYTWKSFVSTLRRLICNPTYVSLSLAGCCSIYFIGGIMAFLPKYIEAQFSIPAWLASPITGTVLGVSGFLGAFSGGILHSKYTFTFRNKVILIISTLAVSAILCIPTMLIGCDSITLAPTASESCHVTCGCSSDGLDPVCDTSAGLTFLTPCQAGCVSLNKSEIIEPVTKSYHNCSCSQTGHVISGWCPRDCTSSLVLYLLVIFVMVFLRATLNSPILVITLGCVNKADKALAIGLLTCIVSLLGWMPAATVTGLVIDSTCSIWRSTCGNQGSCWLYHGDDLRHGIHGVTMGFAVAELIIFFGVLYFSRGKFLDIDNKRRPEMK